MRADWQWRHACYCIICSLVATAHGRPQLNHFAVTHDRPSPLSGAAPDERQRQKVDNGGWDEGVRRYRQAVQLGNTPCSCLFVPSAAAVNRRRRSLIGHRPALRHERKQGELIQARGGGMGRAPRGRQEP